MIIPLPGNVTTGHVTGKFFAVDDGLNSEAMRDLTVTFTPSVAQLIDALDTTVFMTTPVVCSIDVNGNLCGPSGVAGVDLIATDCARLSPTEWTYLVSFMLVQTLVFVPFSIAVATGSNVDLSSVIPQPMSSGTVVMWNPTESAAAIVIERSAVATLINKTLATGTVAVTQTPSDNTTKVATTAFVKAAADTKQPLDAELTVLAGLTPTTGNMILSAAGAWTSATPATVKTALALNNVDNTSDAYDHAITATLTNKRITPRIGTVANSATPTPAGDSNDQFNVTALAQAAVVQAPTGTPTDGQELFIRIKGDATPRALTWAAIYTASGVNALLTTTVANKTHMIRFRYDSAAVHWVCVYVDATGY